ncbi:MAG: hypothetical protein DRI72_04780, partial [Bacteroidetes bacterium]
MKKLYVLIFIIFFSISVSYGQYGMNISGSHVIVHADTYLKMQGDLKISNTEGLIIKPNAFVTTVGELYLDNAPEALVIESTGAGTGSYIVNGLVNPTGNGTARVQTYIYGEVGSYFLHFVGPTVEDFTSGYNNAIRLQQFDMAILHTFAYEWDSSVDDDDPDVWLNVWPYDYSVPVGDGLLLTNGEAYTEDWLNMIGYPISEPITYAIDYNPNNEYELISNPYTSALNFKDFAESSFNNNKIYTKWWIYSGYGDTPGNWEPWTTAIGGNGELQVGQGCMVQVQPGASGVLNFNNDFKEHSNVPFREVVPNLLKLEVAGGNLGYKDVLYIRFHEEATTDYDIELESKKWNSVSDNATMIRSIAEDGTELAINCLPIVDLNSTLTTVPVHFECGEEAEYNFTFNGIESFDMGTEAYLEDTQIGNHWISIPDEGFEYHFTAGPGEPVDRFYIHFFGPTFTPEIGNDSENGIKIYASGNYAYVLNNTQETIKHVSIHNLMGKTIYKGTL